jgi:hypothetical protein
MRYWSLVVLVWCVGGCLVVEQTGDRDEAQPGERFLCGLRAGCGEITEWYAAEVCAPVRDGSEAAAIYREQMLAAWEEACPAGDATVGEAVCEGVGRDTDDGIIRLCVYSY